MPVKEEEEDTFRDELHLSPMPLYLSINKRFFLSARVSI